MRLLIVVALSIATTGAAADRVAPKSFVTTVGQFGLFEIAAGNLALDKSSDPAIETYGYLMITNHIELRNQLAGIARRTRIPFPSSMGSSHQDALSELRRLSPSIFEREYLAHMVSGHKAAVSMFRSAAAANPETELSRWAKRSVPMMEEHLRLAETLQASLKVTR